MNEQLLSFIEEKKNETISNYNEEATKQMLIIPVLHYLGWNPYDIGHISPEYSVRGKKVDYALMGNSGKKPKVFIEAKKVSESLDNH